MAPRKIVFAFLATFFAFLVWAVGTPSQLGRPHNAAYGCLGGGGGGGFGALGAAAGTNGVLVDADGVLRRQTFADPHGELIKQRIVAARAKLNPQLAKSSKLRMVSLNRLEAAVKKSVKDHANPTEDMLCLAGLTRLRYVFFYPETNDIVIAGPAEAWVADLSGRLMGIETARPILELQDLVAALRAFAPGTRKTPVIFCSIDPTAEGLARMQTFLQRIGSRAVPGDTQTIVDGLRTSMGMQDIRVGGVSPSTHMAQVLIEADYRMKLIGIGVENAPVKMKSYVDRAKPGQVSQNALQRWYFVPDYKCVKVSPDDSGMELVGNGVRLVAEDQVVGQDGNRAAGGRSNSASHGFVDDFTKKYAEISARAPVYAQLRNVIDMAVAAAFIQQHDYYAKAGWRMETFGNEKIVPIETYTTPVHVETVVTSVWRGNKLMTPVGGGVTIQPTQALQTENLLAAETSKLADVRSETRLKDLPAGQWWWDAEVEEPAAAPAKGKAKATAAPKKAR